MAATAFVLGLGTAAQAQEGEPLSGGEIVRLVIGNTISGEMGTPFVEHYRPDGTIVGESQDGRYEGKWTVDDDRLCFEYGEPFGCFRILLRGDAVQFLDEDDQVVGTGTLVPGGLGGE
jgi:hypothetical protein